MSFDFIIVPFAWLFRFLYGLFNSYVLALLLFALVIKLVLLYFSMKGKKSMLKTTRLQPKLKELEKKYAGNKEKHNEEVQKLYKENDVKMLSGCLWSLIPFPILIALYQVIINPLTHIMQLSQTQIDAVTGVLTKLGVAASTTNANYGQITIAQQIFNNFDAVKAAVPQVTKIDFSFLGLNLANTPDYKFLLSGFSWPEFGLFMIPLISAALAFVSMKVAQMGSVPSEQPGMKGMTYLGPVMSLWFGFIMPAGLGIYWIAGNVLQIIQDYFLGKHYIKVLDAEDAARTAKLRAIEEERERKRIEYERLKAENANTRNKNTSKKKVQKVERLEAEKKEADFGKKKLPETTPPKPEVNVDKSRPFARGRAFDPNRYTESQAVIKAKEEETAKEAAKRAAEEAERRDKENFEKFLATGKIEDEAEDYVSDADSDNNLSDSDKN